MFKTLVKLSSIGLFVCFISQNALANTEVSLDYILQLEAHDSDDNRYYSELSSQVTGNHGGGDFLVNYDLSLDYIYEQEQREDNFLVTGSFNSQYKLTPYLSWLLDMEFSEITTAGNNEVDRIDTQIFVNGSTGFRYIFDNLVRGQLSLTGLRNEFYYEESPFDGREDSLQLNYTRPLSQASELSLSFSAIEQRYEDESQSINDADNLRTRLSYDSRSSDYRYNIYVERNDIEFVSQLRDSEESVDGYGINFTYSLNSRSSLLVSYTNSVEQVFSLNAVLIDTQNPLLSAGLVENTSTAVQYSLRNSNDSLSIRFYQNDVNDISQVSANDGVTEGVIVDYSRTINETWSLGARHNEFENEVNDNDFRLSTFTTIYNINRSAVMASEVRFSVEDGTDNGREIDDLVLIYELTANLY